MVSSYYHLLINDVKTNAFLQRVNAAYIFQNFRIRPFITSDSYVPAPSIEMLINLEEPNSRNKHFIEVSPN